MEADVDKLIIQRTRMRDRLADLSSQVMETYRKHGAFCGDLCLCCLANELDLIRRDTTDTQEEDWLDDDDPIYDRDN